MSLAVLRSRALDGLAAPEATVEVHLANGLPSFTLVGLADTKVKEARERVRAALMHSGLEARAGGGACQLKSALACARSGEPQRWAEPLDQPLLTLLRNQWTRITATPGWPQSGGTVPELTTSMFRPPALAMRRLATISL